MKNQLIRLNDQLVPANSDATVTTFETPDSPLAALVGWPAAKMVHKTQRYK
jgi:hypothetical protein